MRRHVLLLTMIGLVLVPDWATAFGFRRLRFCWRPVAGFPVACVAPVMSAPPVVGYCEPIPYCPPVIIPGPVEMMAAPATPSPAPPEQTAKPTPPAVPKEAQPKAAPPMVEAIPPSKPNIKAPEVKPAELKSPPTIRLEPSPSAPQPSLPGILPPGGESVFPKPVEKDPIPMPKKSTASEPIFPMIPPPSLPESKSGGEKLLEAPKLPPLIPPGTGNANLPPLRVPGPNDGERQTVKSSPLLATQPPVQIYWVEGKAPALPASLRKVNFFNHSDQEVELTVQGKTVIVPRKHFVEFEVPAKFSWRYNDYPEQKTSIPVATPGAEIVIRRNAV